MVAAVMSYTGTVENGVVVLPPGVNLPDGTQVRVEPLKRQRRNRATTAGELLLRFAGKAKGLPDDIARNHDHYLHGLPKK
jgi:hypothetical protein